MARHRGVFSTAIHLERELARQQAAQARTQTQAAKAAVRAQKEYERLVVADQRQRERLYLDYRLAQVALQNEQLEQALVQLGKLLSDALCIDSHVNIEGLKQTPEIPLFNPGLLAMVPVPPSLQGYLPPDLSGMQKLLPWARKKYAQDVAVAQQRYDALLASYQEQETARQRDLANAQVQYDRQVHDIHARTAEQHADVDRFQSTFLAGDADAVTAYFRLVLESSNYPEGFSQKMKLAYVPESKQIVVEYDLPSLEVVPPVSLYKYIKARDEITTTARPQAQQRALYSSIVAQVTLRTLHELFEADCKGYLDTIIFNGYVDSVDQGTGRPVRPCVVTVRVTRDVFAQIDLSKVDPVACLKVLNASVSKSPSELIPVRPVLEFTMVDPRFIEKSDVLSELENRPNLMDLTPSEFEALITNLFEKMGLETRLTQASRDGGVDCVAYDPRPIFGGKVVIQAKRYKNTVGVSAVRDLFGTVQNEGASKGILVTTSGYGKAAFDFANGKPLELLDGSNLLYLLAEHAGIEARIETPDNWKDDQPDSSIVC